MAITTFAELKTQIGDFLNRDDLTSVIPTFIDLAESQINRDVRHWRMENRVTTSVTTQYFVRPSDWVQTLRLRLTGGGTDCLELISGSAMDDKRSASNDVSGTPAYYRHVEDQFEVFPTPSSSTDIELVYLQSLPALSDANTTNWLLTYAPDIYLYGSLLHSAPYLQDDTRLTVWAQLYSASVKRLNLESEQSTAGVKGLRFRSRGLDTSRSKY